MAARNTVVDYTPIHTSSFLSLMTTAGTSRKGDIGTPLLLPSLRKVHCFRTGCVGFDNTRRDVVTCRRARIRNREMDSQNGPERHSTTKFSSRGTLTTSTPVNQIQRVKPEILDGHIKQLLVQYVSSTHFVLLEVALTSCYESMVAGQSAVQSPKAEPVFRAKQLLRVGLHPWPVLACMVGDMVRYKREIESRYTLKRDRYRYLVPGTYGVASSSSTHPYLPYISTGTSTVLYAGTTL